MEISIAPVCEFVGVHFYFILVLVFQNLSCGVAVSVLWQEVMHFCLFYILLHHYM